MTKASSPIVRGEAFVMRGVGFAFSGAGMLTGFRY